MNLGTFLLLDLALIGATILALIGIDALRAAYEVERFLWRIVLTAWAAILLGTAITLAALITRTIH